MIRFPQYQQQQPIGPDIAPQFQQPQFMNIQHAQMEPQRDNGGGLLNGAFNLGAALLAKRGLQPNRLTDAPMRQDMLPTRRMGGDYA